MDKSLIFHSVSNNQWGGQERRVFNECRWMEARGYAIALATPADTPLNRKGREAGWQVWDMDFCNASMVNDFLALRRILKTHRPRVFNTHGNMDAKVGMLAARGLDLPCVILSRHITPAVRNTWFNRLIYRSPHYVFTTADCTTAQLVRDLGVPSTQAFTVSSGIVPPSVLPGHEDARQALARNHCKGEDSRFIGYMGRLDPAKGMTDIIRAFGQISGQFPRHHLVLVGGSDDTRSVHELIGQLGLEDRVILPGFTDAPYAYYRAFDCKILASRDNEGIAQSILEAMYAGCPVIGTRVGGIPDVIEDGVTGLLVPPRDPQAIARALVTTLEDKEATQLRRDQAHDYIARHHTLEAMGQKILALMENCPPKP